MSSPPNAGERNLLKIITPGAEHVDALTELAVTTLLESHGHSAPREDYDEYIARTMTRDEVERDIADPGAIYRVAYVDGVAAGYSRITLNVAHPSIATDNLCKMDRLYIAKQFYDQKLGKALFDLNVGIAKEHNQNGMWLYVWQANERALRFYRRQGFTEIEEASFKISERHSNPNYVMFLKF